MWACMRCLSCTQGRQAGTDGGGGGAAPSGRTDVPRPANLLGGVAQRLRGRAGCFVQQGTILLTKRSRAACPQGRLVCKQLCTRI